MVMNGGNTFPLPTWILNEANTFTAAQTFQQETDGGTLIGLTSDSESIAVFKVIKKTFDKDSALFDAAGTSDTAEVYAANADSMVMVAAIILDEAFTLNGDRTTLVVTLGDNDADADDVVVAGAMNLSSDTPGDKYSTRGALWAADEAPVITNRVIDATAVVSGGSAGNLADMTTGQITVVLVVLDWS
jgi:hypothetical protein